VRRFVDLFQRIFQLAVGDFQLGQLQNQRIAALQQEFSSSRWVRSWASRMRFCSLVSGWPSA
jgi:hypothetical protein